MRFELYTFRCLKCYEISDNVKQIITKIMKSDCDHLQNKSLLSGPFHMVFRSPASSISGWLIRSLKIGEKVMKIIKKS